ncbi:MAG TPA: copper chaperone PCu(A)C [Longilinea sp.]|nr:copper chaperone PCu(A)C [Longilinea sp.]
MKNIFFFQEEMQMIKRSALTFFLLIGVTLLSGCAPRNAGLSINDAWARPGKAGGNSAVYFTLKNSTAEADVLLKVDGDVAESVELHESIVDENGTMMMRPLESVPLESHSKVEFKPGGRHVMLFSLEHDLNVGDQFTLTLDFQSNPDLTLQVQVKESPE